MELDELTQTFQIGAREDGIDIDKIAFGRQGIFYTVSNLNNGQAGSTVRPGEEPVGPPLADGLDKFLGCGFGPDSRRDFAGYWNQVTPGNAGKWGWIAPAQRLHDIFEDGDPRIKTIFGGAGDSALVLLAGQVQTWVELDVTCSPTGYNLRKYESSPDDHWIPAGSEWNRGPINEKLLRLADVYLLAAEAAYENSQPDLALDYLNTVRRRADMCDGSEDGIPTQLTAISIDDIRDERRRELAGEGHRFYDIVRWGISDDVLSGLPILGGEMALDYVAGKHDFFPIPQAEVDVLNGAVQQYEGW